MKCEKCNERDANFFYTSNINGNVTKRCLCSECAAQEGLMDHNEMFHNFFRTPFESRSPFGLLDSFWNDSFWNDSFFAPFGALATMSRPVIGDASPVETNNIPTDAGAELKAKRELAELKAKLQNAVEAEDFEKAIELRDQIRAREQKG